ncbi:MAG: hypothetical protein JW833_06565 [Prolixibacteraceae bacterium]|nr:hypothetical protein [Prolixibacteraceae bacterium]
MKKIFLFILFASILISCEKEIVIEYPSFIIAGQTEGEGIKYVDFEPDEKLGDCDETYKACLNLDMNNDSINDFYLYYINDHSLNHVYWYLCIIPYGNNSIYFSTITSPWGEIYFAEALLENDTIGVNSNWMNSKTYLFAKQQTTEWYSSPLEPVTTTKSRGEWMSNQDIYIGVKITINEKELFGWIDMKSTTVFRYAITQPY